VLVVIIIKHARIKYNTRPRVSYSKRLIRQER
jgi:hypothetical protein